MAFKPATGDGYENRDLALVRQVCLYLATKLGDLLEDIAVVGGLAPSLLVDQDALLPNMEPHAGTRDLDLALALPILSTERYQALRARLQGAGFAPDVNREGNPTFQRWITTSGQPIQVDFLIPPSFEGDRGGNLRHIETDLAAVITPGLDLAFRDRRWITLSDFTSFGEQTTRPIPVCGPGAFTVLKSLAFGNRGENKDAYDLFYVWRGVGTEDTARALAALQPDAHVDYALNIIEQDFTEHNHIGPRRTAMFIYGRPDDEIQADVVGQARTLLRSLGR